MIGIDVNDAVIVEQRKILEQALSTNPKTQNALRKLIQMVLKDVRPEVVAAAKSALQSDPRGAAEGIRRTVYKRILGGNLNILNMRKKAGKPTTYEPPRKLDQNPKQRGGNRVARGGRTNKVIHYGPHDRGWILRIVNSGTSGRMAGTRGGKLGGNRGSITARNFFGQSATMALNKAAENLANLIDDEIGRMLKTD